MPQTSGRFFDELGKLLTDAAGAADGLRKEIETVVRGQAERMLRDLDVVQREDEPQTKNLQEPSHSSRKRRSRSS